MTLLEIMIATAVLLIVVLGTSGVRFNTALNSRKAESQIAAGRIGSLLCESWRGFLGNTLYDPVASLNPEVNITKVENGPSVSSGYTEQGCYKYIIDDLNFYTTLSWQDVSPGLRILNVNIAWDQRDYGSATFADTDKTISLTTYAGF